MPDQVTLGVTSGAFFHGRVQPQLFNATSPAAGAGLAIAVSTKYWERWWALSFTLATSSAAADRQVVLSLLEPKGATVAAIPAGNTQGQSLTNTYTFMAGVDTNTSTATTTQLAPLFPMIIPPLYSLSIAVTNIDTGDQIAAVYGYRDRFSTGDDGYPMGGVMIDDSESAFAAARDLTR